MNIANTHSGSCIPPISGYAQSWWAMGNSYLAAADQLLKYPSGQLVVPVLHLLAHALELHLKAFLLSQGISEAKLKSKKISHDIVASLKECRRCDLCNYLSLTKNQVRQIVRVNAYHKGDRELQYFTAQPKTFGSVQDFHEIVTQIAACIFTPITAQSFTELRSHPKKHHEGG